jgi:hypothetical protein
MHRAVHVAPLAFRPVATLEVFDEIGPTPEKPRVLARKQGLVERPHIGTIRIEGHVVGESRHICVNARITDYLRARSDGAAGITRGAGVCGAPACGAR